MIERWDFVKLPKRHVGPFATSIRLAEAEPDVSDTYAELRYENNTRRLRVGMDRAQDYRVYAEVERLDQRPRASWPPTKPEDFWSFDLQTVLARSGLPWEDFGRFGPGDRQEIEKLLTDLVAALESHGRMLLEGGDAEWRRLQMISVERVRRAAQSRDIR